MNEFNFTLEQGTSLKLSTAGKYCDKDIVVTTDNALDNFLSGTSTTLKSNAKSINKYVCYKNPFITNLILPNASTIGEYAFSECSTLVHASLPSVETTGIRIFTSSTALESVELPIVQYINEHSFNGCEKLKSINLQHIYQIVQIFFSVM